MNVKLSSFDLFRLKSNKFINQKSLDKFSKFMS